MDSRLLQQLVKSIQNKIKCPVCGSRYPESAVVFRGRLNSFFLFQLICPHCRSNVFASVMVNDSSFAPKADIFLDPDPKEMPKDKALFLEQKKTNVKETNIKADEVIEFAKFIEKSKTPISEWLK